ncbi:MAG: multicopper oxidase family protein [Myxococcota bacterium]|nr:multicopper oxidase family protein [Myxococcota bacterium]
MRYHLEASALLLLALATMVGCQVEEEPTSAPPEITLVPNETTTTANNTSSANNTTTPVAENNQTPANNTTTAPNATTPEEPVGEPYDFPEIDGWEALEDTNPDPNIVEVNLRASRTDVEVAPGTTLNMMTYNESFPGPLLQAKVGDRVIVHFENALDQPTTVHWHGLRIPDDMDGSPRIQDPVQPGKTFTYDFVVPEAGTFWYHPHVRTNEQLERGLYAPIVIHDPDDPVVDRERVVVVDDVLLDGDDFAPFLAHHMEFVHGRTGNALLINGHLEYPVEATSNARAERWRIINVSNARTFALSLQEGAQMTVAATDGGRLAKPYMTERIEVAVGQRYDILVENEEGTPNSLTAHILTVNAQDEVVESPFELYRVIPEELEPSNFERSAWDGREAPSFSLPADREVEIVLDGHTDSFTGRVVWTLNGEANAKEPLFTFDQDEAIVITLVNMQNPEHPFHLHGQFFEILDDGFGSSQPGLKDTVLVPGRRTVRIRASMKNPGMWMAHCHILEHAELGMMSEIEVTPKETP